MRSCRHHQFYLFCRPEKLKKNFTRQIFTTKNAFEQRFLNGMESLQAKGRSKLPVTKYITQFDEVNQVLLENQHPVPTESMVRGSIIHETLESQLKTNPNQPFFDPKIKEGLERDVAHLIDFVDKFASLGNNIDNQFGVVRELPLRGSPPGSATCLRGVVDCIYTSVDGIVVSETKTTRELRPSLLRLAYHQALTYHFLLSSLIYNKQPLVPLVKSLFKSETDMSIAHSYLESRAGELAGAAGTLRQAGLAPYVNLHFVKYKAGTGLHEEQFFEAPYDHETLLQVFKCRGDFFEQKRSPFGFFLHAAEKGSFKFDVEDLDVSNCTAAERSALRL